MQADDELAAIASERFALVTAAYVAAAGQSRTAACRRRHRDDFVAVHAGVYRVAGAPRSWEQALSAAVLAAGEPVAVSHRSAAIVWGLPGIGGTIPEPTVGHGRGPVPGGVVVHRLRALDGRWVTDVGGLPTRPT